VIRYIGLHEMMQRLRFTDLARRLVLMAALIPMAAILRGRHLRAGQAVAEKQRDYRQHRRRDGKNSHLRRDYTASRQPPAIPSFAGIAAGSWWHRF
jgi:hypothetical protein